MINDSGKQVLFATMECLFSVLFGKFHFHPRAFLQKFGRTSLYFAECHLVFWGPFLQQTIE